MSGGTTANTSALYNHLQSVKDSFSSTVNLKAIVPSGDRVSGGGSDFNIDIHGTLTAVAGSTRDSQEPSKSYDVFLLTYALGFSPPVNQEIALYSISLRALQDENTANCSFVTTSEPWPNFWGGNDDFSGNDWGWNDPPTLVNSVWLSTTPDSMENTKSYGTSSSFSFGVNAGFFGGTPTTGVDANWSASTSKTISVIPVKITNRSKNNELQIHFVPQSDKSSNFQPTVEGVLKINDDEQGKRSAADSETTARKVSIELVVVIIPKNQYITREVKTGREMIYNSPDGGPVYDDVYKKEYTSAYHKLVRRIHLRLPFVAHMT